LELTRGIYAEPEDTVLTTRAIEYLTTGPADVVDLIGHICSLPRAPRIVAEHMAHAMFAGRREFVRQQDGRWMLSGLAAPGYSAPATPRLHSASHGSDRLCDLSYVVVDTETTGGQSYYADRITEFAAVTVRAGQVVDVYETLVNPLRPIPPFVSRLTNITWSMVKDAPTFDRIAPEVMRVLHGNVFVAHNANFDWRFVTQELSRSAGHRLRGRKLCTVKLARKVLPQLSRRSLDHIARFYGVEITRRHRAGGDALATAKCLIRMIRDLSDRGCYTWEDLEHLLGTSSGNRRKRRAPALPHSVTKDTTA
jgi:DNA polymerase-3 subunit epsilon